MRLRTYTLAHANNQNELWGDYTDVIATSGLVNPSFEAGTAPWLFYTNAQGSFTTAGPGFAGNAAARLEIAKVGSNMQFYQANFTLEPATGYRLQFAAKFSTGHDLSVYLQRNSSPYTNYGVNNFRVNLTTAWKTFTIEFTSKGFTAATSDTRLRFWLANLAKASDSYWIDEVSLVKVISTATAADAPLLATGNVVGLVQGVNEPVAVTLVDLDSEGAAHQVTTTTDGAGAFRWEAVPAGAYELGVTPPAGYATPEAVQLAVGEEPNEEIVFVLEKATGSTYLPLISR
jgi:hypothetical protein